MTLRTLVVDDEPLAVARLEALLARIPDVAIVPHASTGKAAIGRVQSAEVDLCLLDIAIPDMTGIEIARTFAQFAKPPKIVFVTAYDGFAVAAFEAEAVDYLLKPVEPPRLLRALERARRALDAPRSMGSTYIEEFWVSEHQGAARIGVEEVDRITAERDYMRLHAGTRSWLVNDSMTRLERDLDPKKFVRLHRGAIVNRQFIRGLRYEATGWVARLGDGSEQKIGRLYVRNARSLRASGQQ